LIAHFRGIYALHMPMKLAIAHAGHVARCYHGSKFRMATLLAADTLPVDGALIIVARSAMPVT